MKKKNQKLVVDSEEAVLYQEPENQSFISITKTWLDSSINDCEIALDKMTEQIHKVAESNCMFINH